MAGGIGSRFWPLSRTTKPKQFLDILGTGKTLIQQTFERFTDVIPIENILIVSNENYKDQILEQLPELNEDQVLLEPQRRNTAPCIAYANYKILKENKDANIVVAPSDHLILKEEKFKEVLQKALEFVEENKVLLTLGINPSRPETGYGYIQIENPGNITLNESFRKVKTFTEKPSLEMANVFLDSGDFFWNSGIFFWNLQTIIQAFKENLPEVDNLFVQGRDLIGTNKEKDFISETYSAVKNISIDYGVMEKADNVYVLCSDFGWSDLGTWGSLHDHYEKDDHMNSINGDKIFTYDTTNSLINLPNDKLAVIQGLDDYIVVESENILLICKKNEEQRIKHFVNNIKMKYGNDYH